MTYQITVVDEVFDINMTTEVFNLEVQGVGAQGDTGATGPKGDTGSNLNNITGARIGAAIAAQPLLGEASLLALYDDNAYARGDRSGLTTAVEFGDLFDFARATVKYTHDASGALVQNGVNVPAFQFDRLTGERKGLDIEPARTNRAEDSDVELAAGKWLNSPTGSTSVTAATQKYTTAQPAYKIIPTTDDNAHLHFDLHTGVAVNTAVEFWAVVEAAGYSRVELGLSNTGYTDGTAIYDLTGSGSVVTESAGVNGASAEHIGDDLYLIKVNATTDADGGNLVHFIRPVPSDATVIGATYAGDGTSGVIVHHVQVGAPGTPIFTTGATASHTADLLEVKPAVVADVVSATEGTVFVEGVAYQTGASTYILNLSETSSGFDDRIQITLSDAGNFQGACVFGGTVQDGVNSFGYTYGETFKIALAYAADRMAYCFDGGAVDTSTSTTIQTEFVRLLLGRSPVNAQNAAAHFAKFAYIPRALTDAELQAITS